MVHAIAARTNASMIIPFRPGHNGGAGGSGRECGALTEAAVVVTLTVIFVAELPGVTALGETVQVASDGAPAHAKLTAWSRPPMLVAVNV